jgi:hypothetical protein
MRLTLPFWLAPASAWLVLAAVQAGPTSADRPRPAGTQRAANPAPDEGLRQLEQQARRQESESRMSLAMRVAAAWALFLAVAVSCLWADEATRGRYRRWWWMGGSAVLVGAAATMCWFL